jgi:hypothetical protein
LLPTLLWKSWGICGSKVVTRYSSGFGDSVRRRGVQIRLGEGFRLDRELAR